MRIKIAVCDDNPKVQSDIDNILMRILQGHSIFYEIDIFNNGEECCKELEKEKYDIIFLDIELPGMNGIQVGHYIREKLQNEMLEIVYISGRQDYAMELFEYRPFDFLIKPLNKEKLQKIIDKYLTIIRQNELIFMYKKGTQLYKIPVSDIYYFNSRGRKVIVVYRNGKEEFYCTLEQVYMKVKGNQFIYVHQSFIVNYQYIRQFEYKQLTLFDGTVIQTKAEHSIYRRNITMLEKKEIIEKEIFNNVISVFDYIWKCCCCVCKN